MTLNFSKLKERLQGEDVQNIISLMCLCMPMYINKIIFFLFLLKGSLRQGIVGKDREDRTEEGKALTAGTDLDKYTHPCTLASGNASGV